MYNSSQEQSRSLLRAETVRQGEFNMVVAGKGAGKSAMSLHKQCPVVGDVHMIVGENVGVEYGIVWDPQFSEAWTSGTPGGISGETRLLGQTGIFPSRLDAANLGGNLPQLVVVTSRFPVVGS